MDLSARRVRAVARDLLPRTVSRVETVALTSLARAGGCAAKYSAARLETLLAGLVPAEAEDLLVGLDPADDAAVYRLDDDRAIVFTVDFFPPLVDDPRTFGAIAATNALNDVFAMGGRAAPRALDRRVSRRSSRSRCSATCSPARTSACARPVRSSRAATRFATTSRSTGSPSSAPCTRSAIWPKAGARPGDVLFLTKPLGTGIVLQAQRDGVAPPGALEAAVDSMLELNRAAADALRPFEPNAVTDVTGFGLLGHAHELASRSGVRAVLDADALPALPGALELARDGVRTGGDRRNREFAGPHVESHARRGAGRRSPTTRRPPGGLLVSMPGERAPVLEATFAAEGLSLARIGRVEEGSGVVLALDGRRRRARPLGLGADAPPPRARVVRRALPRRHVRRVRPAHGLGARLRELAELRRQALSGAGLPRLRRVRQPDGRARRDRAHARHLARVAAGATVSRDGAVGRARRVPRRRRADPDGRDHDRARPPPARGHDALPPRAHGVRARR